MNNNKEQIKYRAFRFSINIVKFTTVLPNQRIFWIISDQLLRSATSIGANIVEAQASSSRREFIKFYEIALKSANETLYWLAILRDGTEYKKVEINGFIEECKNLANILGASLLTLKGKRKL